MRERKWLKLIGGDAETKSLQKFILENTGKYRVCSKENIPPDTSKIYKLRVIPTSTPLLLEVLANLTIEKRGPKRKVPATAHSEKMASRRAARRAEQKLKARAA